MTLSSRRHANTKYEVFPIAWDLHPWGCQSASNPHPLPLTPSQGGRVIRILRITLRVRGEEAGARSFMEYPPTLWKRQRPTSASTIRNEASVSKLFQPVEKLRAVGYSPIKRPRINPERPCFTVFFADLGLVIGPQKPYHRVFQQAGLFLRHDERASASCLITSRPWVTALISRPSVWSCRSCRDLIGSSHCCTCRDTTGRPRRTSGGVSAYIVCSSDQFCAASSSAPRRPIRTC